MFAKGESRKRRDKTVSKVSLEKQKNRNFGLKFSTFQGRIACCVRESRDRRDRISNKNSQKRSFFFACLGYFSKSGCASLLENVIFGAKKLILGGYNFKIGQPETILGHIQASPTRFLAQKTFVILISPFSLCVLFGCSSPSRICTVPRSQYVV